MARPKEITSVGLSLDKLVLNHWETKATPNIFRTFPDHAAEMSNGVTSTWAHGIGVDVVDFKVPHRNVKLRHSSSHRFIFSTNGVIFKSLRMSQNAMLIFLLGV